MNERTAAESLRSLGSDLYEIAARMDAVVLDCDHVTEDRYELLRRGERTTIYVHPSAGARVVACAVVHLASLRWPARLDVERCAAALLRLVRD